MTLYDPDRARAALEQAGAAAVLATTPPNVRYLTRIGRASGAVAVLTVEEPEHPTLLVPGSDIDYVLEDPDPDVDVVAYGTFYRAFTHDDLPEREAAVRRLHEEMLWDADAAHAVAEVLEGVQGPVIADAPPEAIPGLPEAVPDVTVIADPDLFRRLRMVKTDEEIQRLQTAARITEEAIAASLATVRPGAVQADVARAFAAAVVTRGAEVHADNVSIDEATALGNVNLPDDRIGAGSLIRYHVGATHRGYAAELGRCFSLRPPGHRNRAEYEALLAGQQAALDQLRPGLRASQLFATTVAEVRRRGIASYQRTHMGHGLGLAGDRDLPVLAPHDQTIIEAGMVLLVEAPYYDVGRIGLQVADMAVVTDDGCELMSRSSRQLEAPR